MASHAGNEHISRQPVPGNLQEFNGNLQEEKPFQIKRFTSLGLKDIVREKPHVLPKEVLYHALKCVPPKLPIQIDPYDKALLL